MSDRGNSNVVGGVGDRFLLEIGEHVTVRLCFYQSLDIEVSM